MEKVILTQISIEEFRQIIREEIESALQDFKQNGSFEQVEEILDVDATAKFLGISKGCLYKKTYKMEIPRFKRGKRLYFKRSELIEWISEGKLKTMKDIEMEAANYLAARHKRSRR